MEPRISRMSADYHSEYFRDRRVFRALDDRDASVVLRRIESNIGEVKIGGDEGVPVSPRMLRHLLVGGRSQANVAHVRRLVGRAPNEVGGAAREAGINQKMHRSRARALELVGGRLVWHEREPGKLLVGERHRRANILVGKVVFASKGFEGVAAGQVPQDRRDGRAGAADDRLAVAD